MASKYDQFLKRALECVERGESIADFARQIVIEEGLDADPENVRKTISKKINEIKRGELEIDGIDAGPVTSAGTSNPQSFEAKENTATWSMKTKVRITTLEEALKYCDVDLTEWDVERWTFNKWEQNNADEGIVPLYQVKVIFTKKKLEDAFFGNVEAIERLISKTPPVFQERVYEDYTDPVMLEVCAYDVHYGQLAWLPESGVNFDTKIARKRMMKHMGSLLTKSSGLNVEKVLFTIGNDYFNSDNLENTTTAGTPQQEDGRWMKTFDEGTQLLIDVIDMWSEFAPVDVVLVQGNHDWQRSFYAAKVLEKHYQDSPYVEVQVDYFPRKYYQYGKCLIGLTHGNNEKEDELPMIMAQEQPQMWADTVYREWHLGHLHHARKKVTRSSQEYRGVMIQRLRSFQPTDAWHAQKGFNGSLNSLYAFAWHKDDGKIMELNENIKFD